MTEIMLIEDDPAIRDLLDIHLSMAGYKITATDKIMEASSMIHEGNYSLVILDLTLSDGDGLSFIPRCSAYSIPVLVLTADNSLPRKVRSLNLGADDYMVKPFEAAELIARIGAILRRFDRSPELVRIGESLVDRDKRTIMRSGEEIVLTSKEWHLLLFLIKNKGYVLNRKQLLENVWGYDFYGNSRTVDMHIQKLRKKLDTDAISTVFKEGYRLDL